MIINNKTSSPRRRDYRTHQTPLIKYNNQMWTIHKYDPDPFPSDPHAHNNDGEKLDLSNGDLYQNAKWKKRIGKKDLKEIRRRFNKNTPDLTLPELTV